ncbi:MAG: hypothetical protein PVH61_43715, partial [Candidatus Aminicenantes bacterium]
MSAIVTFIKAFEKVTDQSDKEPPLIVKSEGILILPISIKDVTLEDSPETIEIQSRVLNSGTEVRIKPLSQLKENH